eukprot:907739-Rhodomonas_salina.6
MVTTLLSLRADPNVATKVCFISSAEKRHIMPALTLTPVTREEKKGWCGEGRRVELGRGRGLVTWCVAFCLGQHSIRSLCDGGTALMKAAVKGNVEVIEKLLAGKADPNAHQRVRMLPFHEEQHALR